MLVPSLLSIALAAGSALAVPVAVIQGGLHKRDHSVIQARANGHSHNLHIRQNPDADSNVLWVTEVSFVTVVVNQKGVPQTTKSGGTQVTTLFPTSTAPWFQAASVTSTTSTLAAPSVSSSSAALTSATPSSVSAEDAVANFEVSSAASIVTSSSASLSSAPLSSATTSSVSVEDDVIANFEASSAAPETTLVPTSTLVSSTLASSSSVSSTLSSVVESSTPSTSFVSSTPTSTVVESSSSSVVEQSSTIATTTSTFSSSVAEPSLTSTTLSSSTISSSSSAISSSTAVESATATSSANSNGLRVPETITYSPYHDDSTCKDADAVRADLSTIAAKGIKTVRIYNTDCNTITTVEPTARDLGLKIDQGFWIGPLGADSIDSGVQELIDWVSNENGNDWSLFSIITVGNEAVYGNHIDAPTLLSKIKEVKKKLRAAGWNGSVTTAETPSTYSGYPELCTDSDGIDVIGVNAHPYFNAAGSASDSGDFINAQIETVKGICGSNVNVRITETGYPSSGDTNGNQVPTKENQAIAIEQIIDATNNKAVMFTMYDDYWKAPGPYNVEQHFGIFHLFE
ncbi:hypothetical protein DV451_003011 [Geotrichum candidum]|uniref:Glycoside hydrolase family 17 protein n=1 Tax=Geotrichum candidum TaxID=1173061 RepID=A0A9P5KSZ1_GEOCN|nr:hypothetical protein DV451_003011 [Geotrichum candidum]KAF5109722.1 hypothetical protein DV453_001328 [Geotrichum candidum]